MSTRLDSFEKKTLSVRDTQLPVFTKIKINKAPEVTRLIIAAKLPDPKAIQLLQLCVESIRKFTPEKDYELWVVDNNSPLENLAWLIKQEDINIILSRTDFPEAPSFENAIAIEAAISELNPATKYVMTFHQDTVVCQSNWLQTMLHKFNDKVRAVGVREDKVRTPAGVLHVLGYIVDFQLFKKLKLSYLPDLPQYDVGDKVSVELRAAGYQTFAFANTLRDPSALERLSPESPFREYSFDRAVDDHNQVFFMHLGRGVMKSTGEHVDEKRSITVWARFIQQNLFGVQFVPAVDKLKQIQHKLFSDLWYSPRRYYVDKFFLEEVSGFKVNDKIIDLGGKKANKRGDFNIGEYPLEVKYANIDESSAPDYLCDITKVPCADASFDGAILGEVLEHVRNPAEILAEAYRLLKPGGRLLITTPFMYNVHADPYDFQRFTDYWYVETLKKIGFADVRIEKHGALFTTVANIFKTWIYSISDVWPRRRIVRSIVHRSIFWFTKKSLQWDQRELFLGNKVFAGNSTGYGVVAVKH